MKLANNLLKAIPFSQLAAGGKELVIRCPYCGHTSSKGKRHMYISVSDDKPIMYNCFKCEAKGIANKNFLNDIGLRDTNLIAQIESHNRAINRNSSSVLYGESRRQYQSVFSTDNALVRLSDFKDKLNYVRMRLGNNLPDSYLLSCRLVFDVSPFFGAIRKIFRATDEDLMRIQKDYVGFLSTNGTALILRCIKQVDSKFRYIIVKLYEENFTKIYSMPTSVNIMEQCPEVHITEGQFDILSVYFNMKQMSNGIYLAASGNKYLAALSYIISKGVIDMNLNLYFDNDDAGSISEKQMLSFIKGNARLFERSSITFHKNMKDKDFGVPLEMIEDKITRIK